MSSFTPVAPYHIVFGTSWRTRFFASDAEAQRLGERLHRLGPRIACLAPPGSLAATLPWSVQVYRDREIAGALQVYCEPCTLVFDSKAQ